ncbi:MAG: hypothetical protein M1376_11500 [Planctomycetes bacterium]|nr:hypothetical protein [Planctomycetota bacterium]
MSKRCVCSVLLLMMLGGAVYGAFDPLADSALIAWWKCDEGSGSVVGDSGPGKHDGTFVNGAPAWTDGVNGSAVRLAGPTLVEVPPLQVTLTQATMCGWFLPNGTQNDWASMIMHRGTGLAHGFNFLASRQLAYHWADAAETWSYRGTAYYAADDWTHCAVTIEPTKATFYVNGAMICSNNVTHAAANWDNVVHLGGDDPASWAGRQMNGSLDDVMFFSRALTPAEIKDLVPPQLKARKPNPANKTVGVNTPLLQWAAGDKALFHDVYVGTSPDLTAADLKAAHQPFAMFYNVAGFQPGATYYWRVDEIAADGTVTTGDVWNFVTQALTAYLPAPVDQAAGISPATTLSWQPGQNAAKHHLYLGDSKDAVTQGAAEADKGEVEGTTYTPKDLQGATTYYWRVDEVTAAGQTQTGPVWSFTTFILVDDFESYTDEEGGRIFDVWVDGWTNGTGSTVGNTTAPFAEQTIVHSGKQSLPMDFDNSKSPFYSEAELALASVQNWTAGDVNTLSLWVQGYPPLTTVAVTEAAGKITLTGDGTDIWNNSDQFTFAYKTLDGDGSIIARVASVGTGSNTWAKGGVMIRDSLNGGSTFANMVITGGGGNGASTQYRLAADGACGDGADAVSVVTAPYWVKIERRVNDISAYYSADGKTWRTLGMTQTIEMAAPVYIGLCVTSHAAGEDRTFEFDNITTTGGVTGSWQGAAITSPRFNSATSMYVALEDSAGKVAVVSDPALANTDAWTRWTIPLSSFAGMNLAKVEKLYIGVGDRANPTAGSSGRIYIDDIRVIKP